MWTYESKTPTFCIRSNPKNQNVGLKLRFLRDAVLSNNPKREELAQAIASIANAFD
jgi:hypothetical protein